MDGEKMKERPILFKAEMVQAILGGRKTQTRRVVKLSLPDGVQAHQVRLDRCPYGIPGDWLWVRETWVEGPGDGTPYLYRADADTDGTVPYLSGGAGGFGGGVSNANISRWKPSIHMPRWASRITLEVTNVRVERLQRISEDDAMAEGIYPITDSLSNCNGARYYFQSLWDSINAKLGHSWESNPFVWVVEFKRVAQ